MILKEIPVVPGEVKTAELPVPGYDPIAMTIIAGVHPGKTLVITAGVHGCEYVGIQAARELIAELDPAEISGRVVILPLVNAQGFYHGAKQIVPEDGKNLNRVFPGDVSGTAAERIAAVIEAEVYPVADFLVDLHGADINEQIVPLVFFPAKAAPEVTAVARAAAESLSVPLRVASDGRSGLYSWAAQRGVPSMLVERGGMGLWTTDEVSACKNDVYRLLAHMGIIDRPAEPVTQREISQAVYAEAEADGFWYPTVTAGEQLYCGQLLGEVRDIHNRVLQQVLARFDGEVLYFTLSLGVRRSDPLVAYGQE